MGKRGPKPKPTALRVLEGNPGRLPIQPDEPKPSGGISMPEHLQEASKKVWNQIIESMPPSFFSVADMPLLAAFCEAWADHSRATEALAHGADMANGGRVSPLITIRNQAARTMATLGSRLGLSPADRVGLKTPAPQEGGKWGGGLIG